ncbi:hypothetical protein, partial [Corallococcus exiguus]|uniref:hypothetical protein n=1 Tax=Corallococcus exiguus TaxID=83462 RepID=UPI001B8B6023
EQHEEVLPEEATKAKTLPDHASYASIERRPKSEVSATRMHAGARAGRAPLPKVGLGSTVNFRRLIRITSRIA